MAKHTPNSPKRGRPAGRKPSVMISVRVEPSIADRLERYKDSVKPETTLKAILKLAIEEYLAKVGFPP